MTLCIVDMQPNFLLAKQKRTIKATVEEIKKAKKNREGIVVLEYEEEGETHPSILRALGQYKRVAFEKKDDDDGGDEFVQACDRHQFSLRQVKVCGVNVFACVYRTINGIKRHRPNTRVVVIYKAVHDNWRSRSDQKDFLSHMADVDALV